MTEQPEQPEQPLDTGNEAVDAALRSLEGLEGLPVSEQIAVFEAAHEALRAALTDAGERPDDALDR